MAKPELGMKRVCPKCDTRYYDMTKLPPVCPSCGTVYDPEEVMGARRGRSAVLEDAKKAKEQQAMAADDNLLDIDDDAVPEAEGDQDPSLIEDASELGDDEDEMGLSGTEDGDEEP